MYTPKVVTHYEIQASVLQELIYECYPETDYDFVSDMELGDGCFEYNAVSPIALTASFLEDVANDEILYVGDVFLCGLCALGKIPAGNYLVQVPL